MRIGKKDGVYVKGIAISWGKPVHTFPHQKQLGIRIYDGAYTKSIHFVLELVIRELHIAVGRV